MKIVHISPVLPQRKKTTGAVLATHELATSQVDAGHEVVVAGPYPPELPYRYEWKRLRLGVLPRPVRWFLFPLSLQFQRWRFDVAIVHGEDWFWLARRIPTVRIMYGSALREAEFATRRRRRYSQLLIGTLERLSRRLSTVTLEITDSADRHVNLLPLGYDPNRFFPGTKSAHPSILFVGTWHGRKRGNLVYSTFLQLREAFPGLQLTMVCADAPDNIDAEVISYAEEEDLAELYRRSWLLLHPATYEGFGLPYLEAMASATAVVSSPNPGAQMLLVPGGQSIAEDSELLDVTASLLRDSELRESSEQRGLDFARERTWQRCGNELASWCKVAVRRSGHITDD